MPKLSKQLFDLLQAIQEWSQQGGSFDRLKPIFFEREFSLKDFEPCSRQRPLRDERHGPLVNRPSHSIIAGLLFVRFFKICQHEF